MICVEKIESCEFRTLAYETIRRRKTAGSTGLDRFVT